MPWRELYKKWKNKENLDQAVKNSLEEQVGDETKDAFDNVLSFGTAGMRGIIGAGPNRMNIYTVRQATEGLAMLINEVGLEAKERGVVIAYDSRHYSPEFAMEAALVLGKHGIKVYLYESLRPTPTLSFAVRYLHAYAGIMVTASHNPAEYNGYKVYGEDGGQMPPEDADKLTQYVRSIEDPLAIEVGNKTELLGSGKVEIIGDRVDQAYLAEIAKVTIDSDLIAEMAEEVKIVFTPLHGTGMYLGMKALEQAGFSNIHVVEEQAEPDGDFPTLKSPNPESPESFDLAEQIGRNIEADILLATDPDADRLGAMLRTQEGNYQLLSGNQIACLMLDYMLKAYQAKDQLPENGVIIKSIVSTDLAEEIAKAYKVETVDVLTGFKFIAEKIKQYEESKAHSFIMGFEESFGYLLKSFTRDKDAIQALVMLAELTAFYKKQNKTLAEALISIYEEYGYYKEKTLSISFASLEGKKEMEALMEETRSNRLTEVAGISVAEAYDYLNSSLIYADGKESNLSYPKSNVLKYKLEDGSWIALRPSGTEPKIKLYMGAKAESERAANNKLVRLEEFLNQLIK
ncbi:phospho-sugar mutase [Facklamia sp. 7083-14-GEN3]|uniref:phospho-sugar mutase n=1 Tax=Facklamia sp. 7083-14-GEN3 TaxID=2973478 RepID=UPI00215B9879|nr:phospho-sugar mutase [Facklamia sp. 7083-14-GEN3]MCR8969650.1 phospho-sugar mutase [Facklamia sp. 7083-14-GEN3]